MRFGAFDLALLRCTVEGTSDTVILARWVREERPVYDLKRLARKYLQR
ncbi:hypothetical protein LCGC14_2692080 [marine sediment metagenome]|uniref:Uncharacterized protein n=1 Tax=marine sediment metagenome TaxID=412755 RepID=A0A0F9CA29_9ZZZZ